MLIQRAPSLSTNTKYIDKDQNGEWHLRGFLETRQLMLMDVTQAGFSAELVLALPGNMVRPVLFVDGEEHLDQRREIAKFFTPTRNAHHQPIMDNHADRVVAEFKRVGKADLHEMATATATGVVAEVVGLTNSTRTGMAKRIERILDISSAIEVQKSRSPRNLLIIGYLQWLMFKFWLLDVRSAIKARRQQPQTDVISHMLQHNAPTIAIMAECVTYSIAGMTTTRELTALALWHCMCRPDLRAIMTGDDREARFRLLYEIIRVEPVIGELHRRTQTDLAIESEGQAITIPAGSLIHFHIHDINTDARVVGEKPALLGLERSLEKRTPCPGEFLAIAQVDTLVHRLLKIDSLRIEREPSHHFNPTVGTNEFKGFIISCNPSLS
jgi:cytochrome P450